MISLSCFPPEVWDIILGMTLIRTILQLSQTCRIMHNITNHYLISSFNITKILLPYFHTPENVMQFHEMMTHTGAVISGSTALQFFARTHYDESDLDVYMESQHLEEGTETIYALGYQKMERDDSDDGDIQAMEDAYPNTLHIETVNTFKNYESNKTIQLVATNCPPLITILDFHSSASSHIHHTKILC